MSEHTIENTKTITIENGIEIEIYQDSNWMDMSQEEFRLALIELESALCKRNELFEWEIEENQDITNAFCGDIRISYNDGSPVIIDKSGTMYLAEYMSNK